MIPEELEDEDQDWCEECDNPMDECECEELKPAA